MSARDLDSVGRSITRAAVTIGMFDGVHLGHRALLDALKQEAELIRGQSVVLTFDRHPAETVRPDRAPEFISGLAQRVAAIEGAGVDIVVVAPFDDTIASLSPGEFFDAILVDKLKAAVVVVGPDFRFGRNRAGNFARMAELGVERGVAAVAIPPIMIDDAPVSSTRIRKLIAHGAVEDAARLLGRPFVLEGVVVKGTGMGKRLGFPTANLSVDPRQILPGSGVYTADVFVAGRGYRGVVSVGTNPTLGGTSLVVEAYIADFEEDIYGEKLRIGFRTRLRDQRKFSSLDKLVQQIRRDVELALNHSPEEITPYPRQVT